MKDETCSQRHAHAQVGVMREPASREASLEKLCGSDPKEEENAMENQGKPGLTEYWHVSPFNFAPCAHDSVPRNVRILDTTLRDGISDPARSISLKPSEKVRIAKILDGLGIPQIEIGLTTDDDLPVLKEITKESLGCKTFAMTPTSSFTWDEWKAVDIALEADLDGIVCNFPASEYLVEKFLPGWSMQKMMEKAISMASYAKENGLHVDFFGYDTTRADPRYLEQLYRAAAAINVDSITIVDTLGVASPRGIRHLVQLVRSWVDTPIGLHMHNDFSLATANILAGIENGVQAIHTTINGIGKMAPTESLIPILHILYGIEFSVKYSGIYQACKDIRQIGGWDISPYDPIFGDLAFAYDSDHRLEENRSQKAPFLPEFIGHRYRVLLNANTGPIGMKYRLHDLKKEATDEQVERILAKVKEHLAKSGKVSDEEFEDIVDRVLGKN